MTAYLIATVRIDDPEKFGAYTKAIAGLSEKFGGEYIVRGKVTEVLEGNVDPEERVVVSKFPTAEAAKGYMTSAEYLAGKEHRIGAGEVNMRLLVVPA